jgi:hypothetical protein
MSRRFWSATCVLRKRLRLSFRFLACQPSLIGCECNSRQRKSSVASPSGEHDERRSATHVVSPLRGDGPRIQIVLGEALDTASNCYDFNSAGSRPKDAAKKFNESAIRQQKEGNASQRQTDNCVFHSTSGYSSRAEVKQMGLPLFVTAVYAAYNDYEVAGLKHVYLAHNSGVPRCRCNWWYLHSFQPTNQLWKLRDSHALSPSI